MKNLLIALLVLLGIGVVAMVTCPERDAHKEAINDIVRAAIQSEVGSDDEDGFLILAGALGNSLAGYYIDNMLIFENHFVYSTGTLKDFENENHLVTVGVFGHIFITDKELVNEWSTGLE